MTPDVRRAPCSGSSIGVLEPVEALLEMGGAGERHRRVDPGRQARQPVEQHVDLRSLVHEVAGRARARRDQIDEALERRRRGLERASKVVLRPVQVANGIAAAVVTTVTTLVRPSVSR